MCLKKFNNKNVSNCHRRNPRWNAEVPLPCCCCCLAVVTALLSTASSRAQTHAGILRAGVPESTLARSFSLLMISYRCLLFSFYTERKSFCGWWFRLPVAKLEYFWVGMFYAWSQLDVFCSRTSSTRYFQWIWIEWKYLGNKITKFFSICSINSIVTRHHTDTKRNDFHHTLCRAASFR